MKIFKYVFLSVLLNLGMQTTMFPMQQRQPEQIAQSLLTRLIDTLKKNSRLSFQMTNLAMEFRREISILEVNQRLEIEAIFALRLDKLLREHPIDCTDFYKISKDGIITYRFLEFKHYEFDRLLKLTEDTIKATDPELYVKIAPRLWSDQMVRTISNIDYVFIAVRNFSTEILLPCMLLPDTERIEFMKEFIIELNDKIKTFDR